VFASACGGGDLDGTDDNGPVVFTVLLSAGCDGRINNADILFDNRFIGNLAPGNSTEITTTRGEHTLEARADTGATLGPLQIVIEFDGQMQTLLCNALG